MTKPKIQKRGKLPPPKKMSPKEAKAAAKRNSDAIQGKPVTKPKIKKTLVAVMEQPPYVFYDCHRRVHLLVAEGEKFNSYLTMGSEQIEVVKLPLGEPVRNQKGHLPEDTTCVGDLKKCDYDLKKAAGKFYNSFLPKSFEATKALCIILGKPAPEISETVKAVRKAAGERLKAARPQLTKPNDEALVTLVSGAVGQAPSARAGKILKILGGHKKGLSVAELCEQIGVPIYATVAKLAELGLVQVKKQFQHYNDKGTCKHG